MDTTLLHATCEPGRGDVPLLEASFFGTCWGHIGHHTYYVAEPRVLRGVVGTVFAVEVSMSEVAGPVEVTFATSMDGLAWQPFGAVDYPLGQEPEDRYEIQVNLTGEAPIRFLRIQMPPSVYDGLAGYLDNSNLTLLVEPLRGAGTGAPALRSGDCDSDLMEDFFGEHPCWFGGYDAIDRVQGGGPQIVHVAAAETEGSWWDSPSFLHTYYLGAGAEGTMVATVTAQLWRSAHVARCTAFDPMNVALPPDIVAQASSDGREWVEVARTAGSFLDSVELIGDLPEGSRFLRFGSAMQASYEQGGCHHPASFLVGSRFALT